MLRPVLPRAVFPLQRAASASAALAAVLLAAPAPPAGADFPSDELLERLRARLLEAPACRPDCAASPRLRLEVEPAGLLLRLEIDAAAPTAVPLPGSARDWVPEQVIVDGAPAAGLRLAEDGVLWLQVEPGAHQVLIAGALPERDTIELPLPLKPHRAEASSRGWIVQGIGKDGVPEDNLRLSRVRDANAAAHPALEGSALPAFASVTRMLRLGISWQVETIVTRLTPSDATLALEVPLLAGESVTTAGVRSENGVAFVSLGPGVAQLVWSSALELTPSIELRAPDATNWMETWILDASPIWHIDAEGIPVIHQDASGVRLREWRPWPGERVSVRATRPEGVEGPTLTFDGSRLEVSPGLRATNASLELRLRSSLGGQHVIALPEGALLERVTIDGAEQPIRQEGREVTLPLSPGTRTFNFAWREPRGIATRFASSEVDLHAPSVNADVVLSLPADRWVLWTSGPRLGPSVLFWPLLAVLAAVAVGLGRVGYTPLRARHWFLLGLGLTQVPLAAAAVVAGWLLALGWRGEHGMAVRGRWFDLAQLALALWTLAALGVIFYSIQQGLLGLPEMQVAGHGSSASELRWYQDRADCDAAPPVGALDPAARLPRRDARLGALAGAGAAALAALGLGAIQPRRALARASAHHSPIALDPTRLRLAMRCACRLRGFVSLRGDRLQSGPTRGETQPGHLQSRVGAEQYGRGFGRRPVRQPRGGATSGLSIASGHRCRITRCVRHLRDFRWSRSIPLDLGRLASHPGRGLRHPHPDDWVALPSNESREVVS